MKLHTIGTALVSLIAASAIAAPTPTPDEAAATTPATFDLAIGGGRFDMSELQSSSLFYANSSAYLGQIKYQSYSEPLIVSGASRASSGLTFQSIHDAPTGWQDMYVVPHRSLPVAFGPPHGSPPAGVRSTGFAFDKAGALENHGVNLFYACQDRDLEALHAYQIYWIADGWPRNLTCKGPIGIHAANACARAL
jgi:hypothetical protein